MGHDSVTAPRLFRERRLHRAQKDQTKNKVIQNPGEACAEERQDGEQSKVSRRLGAHFSGPRKRRPAVSQDADR